MKIAIIGLGLIGGSFAKAIKKYIDYTVFGFNRSEIVLQKAIDQKVIDGTDIFSADLFILALYPAATIEFVKNNAEKLKSKIVLDTCGIKTKICEELFKTASEHGFKFFGGHPMAGKEKGGFDNSTADLFKNASFILTPFKKEDADIKIIENLIIKTGFSDFVITTPKEHDEIIAFTSQLPHVLAAAYINDVCAEKHKGFSAGSYRDVSRVAKINAKMWTELFLENSENLSNKIDTLIKNLETIKTAINNKNFETIYNILDVASKRKERFG